MRATAAVLALLVCAAAAGAAAAAALDWSAVDAAAEAFSAYPSLGVVIGNGSGILHTYSKGGFDLGAYISVASASKWVSAAAIFRVIQKSGGALNLNSRPPQWVPAFAGVPPTDPRANMSLALLLAFTDGMTEVPCAESGTVANYTFAQCIDQIARTYAPGNTTLFAPGSTYYYSGAHLQLAGAMPAAAANISGANPWPTLVQQELRAVFGFPLSFFYTPLANPLVAGGLYATPLQYAAILNAYFNGSYLAPSVKQQMEAFVDTPGLVIDYSPLPSWRYGYGHWVECRANSTSSLGGADSPYVCANASSCTSPPVLAWRSACSSACERCSIGKYGMYPYTDTCFNSFTNGYWAVLAVADGSAVLSAQLGSTMWPAVRQAFRSQASATPAPTPTPTSTPTPTGSHSAGARKSALGPWAVTAIALVVAAATSVSRLLGVW